MGVGCKRLAVAAVALLALLMSGCVASSLRALDSEDEARRAQAVETLANAGDSALPHLDKLVDKRDYAKYAGMAQALERIGGERAVEALKRMALDAEAPREARQAALGALETLDGGGLTPWMQELAVKGQAIQALDTAEVLLTLPGEAGARALQAVFVAAPDAQTKTAALQAMLAGRDLLTPWQDELHRAGQYVLLSDIAGMLEQPGSHRAFEAWQRIAATAETPLEIRRQAVGRLFALDHEGALNTLMAMRVDSVLPEELMVDVLAALRPADAASWVDMLIAEAGYARTEGYRAAVLAALKTAGEDAYLSLYRTATAAGIQGSASARARDLTTPEGVLRALGQPAADYLATQENGDTDDARLRYFAQLLCAFGPEGQAARLALALHSASPNGPRALVDALLQAGDSTGAFGLLEQALGTAQDAERLTLCAQLLAESFGNDARAVLEPMLISSEASRRAAALKAFESMPGAPAVETLQAMAAKDETTAQAALTALAALGSEEGDAALLALARQDGLAQERRLRAANLLLQASDGRHIPAIQALLAAAPEGLRLELLRSLAGLKSAQAAAAMATATPLGNRQQRMELVGLLLGMGDPGKAALAGLSAELLKPFAQDAAVLIAEGMAGSEPLLGLILSAYGTLDMANSYLNSGNKTLYDQAVEWGKKNGYKVVSDTGPAEDGTPAWGSGKVTAS